MWLGCELHAEGCLIRPHHYRYGYMVFLIAGEVVEQGQVLVHIDRLATL
jgi:hypothetical protein